MHYYLAHNKIHNRCKIYNRIAHVEIDKNISTCFLTLQLIISSKIMYSRYLLFYYRFEEMTIL